MGFEQISVDAINVHFDAWCAGRISNVEFVANRGEQFLDGQFGIKDIGDIAGRRDLFQQAATYRGFARADITREQYEPAIAVDSIQKMGKRLLVPLAQVEIARVRRDRERCFDESEMVLVHGNRLVKNSRHYSGGPAAFDVPN